MAKTNYNVLTLWSRRFFVQNLFLEILSLLYLVGQKLCSLLFEAISKHFDIEDLKGDFHMTKKFLSILMAFLIAFSMTACSNSNGGQSGSSDTSADTTNAANSSQTQAKPVKDRAGNDITIPENVSRIASMAPSVTQVLVDLGLGDKIVAIDLNAKDLPGVKKDVLVTDMMNPDVEQIVASNPDIIFVSGMSLFTGEDPYKPLKDLGICIAYIPSSNSIEEIKNDITFIADAANASQKGKEICDNMQKELDSVAAIGKTITNKKTVFFEIGAAPDIYSFGTGTFLNEMIELIGATNAFKDQTSWLHIGEEAAVKANPDVILTNVNYIPDPVSEIKSRKGWADVKAIKNGDVYYIDNLASSLPNHNIVKALKEMAKAIYPDKY